MKGFILQLLIFFSSLNQSLAFSVIENTRVLHLNLDSLNTVERKDSIVKYNRAMKTIKIMHIVDGILLIAAGGFAADSYIKAENCQGQLFCFDGLGSALISIGLFVLAIVFFIIPMGLRLGLRRKGKSKK